MDTRTMILLVGIGYVVFGIMLGLAQGPRGTRDRSPFLGLAFVMIGVGSTVQSIGQQLPTLLTVWLGNTMTAAGLLLQAWGVRSLTDRPVTARVKWVSAALLVAVILLAASLHPPARQVWASLVYAALFASPAWTLARWQTTRPALRVAVTTGYSAVSLVFLARSLRILFDPERAGIFLQGDSFSAAYLILYVAMLTSGFGLLLLSKAEADVAVRSTNKELSTILQALPTAMCLIRRGIIVHSNPAAEKMFGYGSGDLDGLNISQLLAPDDADSGRSGRQGHLSPPFEQEMLATGRDGQRRWVWLSAQPLSDDAQGQNAIVSMTEITHMKELQRELTEKATTDDLTGLINRRAFTAAGERSVQFARGSGKPLCLAIVDVDRLKEINDTRGHAVGDQALTRVARACRSAVGDKGEAARLGGDEFALLLPECNAEQGRRLAGKLQADLLADPLNVKGEELQVTTSIGIAELAPDEAFDSLVARADATMYGIKRSGRNGVSLQSDADVI